MIALVGGTRNNVRESTDCQFMRYAEQSTRCVVFRPPSAKDVLRLGVSG